MALLSPTTTGKNINEQEIAYTWTLSYDSTTLDVVISYQGNFCVNTKFVQEDGSTDAISKTINFDDFDHFSFIGVLQAEFSEDGTSGTLTATSMTYKIDGESIAGTGEIGTWGDI